jgi:histidinol-phosphate aminotransferase
MEKISKFATKKIKKLTPYKIASQEIWKTDSKAKLKLDWNEGIDEVPNEIIEPFRKFLDKGLLKYYPNVRNESLLDALAHFNSCNKKYITYFSGIDSGHEYIARAFLELNDKVVMLSPTYDNFRAVCDASEAEVLKYDFFNNKGEFPDLNVDAKLIYFANPNNPTGEIVSKNQLKEYLNKYKNTLFVVDEAYIEFGGVSAVDLVESHENLIICKTLSKSFCLAGIRFGYLIAHEDIITTIDSIRNPKSVSMFSQIIAEAAIRNSEYMWENVAKTNNAKKILRSMLEKNHPNISVSGEHGNFLLLEFENEQEKNNLVQVLEKQGIYIRSTSHLINNSCRITVPPSHKLEPLIKAFEEIT